jgi:hypothetical protein
MEKKWLSEVDHIICVVEEMQARLGEILTAPQKFTILPNYIDPESFLADQYTVPEITGSSREKSASYTTADWIVPVGWKHCWEPEKS